MRLADGAAVLVNFNGGRATSNAVSDLLQTGMRASRIIVVDNASDEELPILSGVTVLRNATNVGFGAAINVGARAAIADGARWLALMNNDIRCPPDVFERLCYKWDGRSIRSPTILRDDGSVWFSGAEIDRALMRTKFFPRGKGGVVGFLSGCFLVTSSEVWQRLGGYDTDFFLYWEDVDLSHRCNLAGIKLEVSDTVEIRHAVGFSSSGDKRGVSIVSSYHHHLNRWRFAFKHAASLPGAPVQFTLAVLRGVKLTTRYLWLKNERPYVRAAFRGEVDGIRLYVRELRAR